MNGRLRRAVAVAVAATALAGPGVLGACSSTAGSTSVDGPAMEAGPAMQPGPAMSAPPETSTRPSSPPAEGRSLPPPVVDTPSAGSDTEIAVLAGGCFWGVQGVFQHVEGVLGAMSGYAGGDAETAHYEQVGTGTTGHAESVRITFDPGTISYGEVLQIFFSVVHDPTQLDRQGPDIGSEYRSTIFPTSAEQADIAAAYVEQLDRLHVFDAAIVTTIEPDRTFFPAEDHHQDFMELDPTHPYIVRNDAPKVDALAHFFPDRYRAEPVLVGGDDLAG